MLDLVTLPDDRLFEISKELKNVDGKLVAFADQMIETMHKKEGVGLAAVQVGRMDRLFVIHLPEEDPRVFINPVIELYSDKIVSFEEGCLSIPGIYSEVKRPDQVRIRALGRNGEEFVLEAEGYLARVIQHEFDHLEGVLFYDHLKDRKKERFLKAYGKSQNKDISPLLAGLA